MRAAHAWIALLAAAGCQDVSQQKAENDRAAAAISAYKASEAVEDAYAARRANYLRDRDALRTKHPKTEASVTALMGRPPDHIVELSDRSLLQWQYKDQADRFDAVQVTIVDGGVTGMNL